MLDMHSLLFAGVAAAATTLFLFAAFVASYAPFPWLKRATGDYECASSQRPHPNGVSGHAFYCMFHALAAAYALTLHRQLAPRSGKPQAACARWGLASLTVWGVVVVGALLVWTMVLTYAYGYHSPRQIALGAALGVPVGLCFMWMLDKVRLVICS